MARPDQHVAWRGDKEPGDPLELIDIVRGARAVRMTGEEPKLGENRKVTVKM
jgi:hypothetical protein